MRKRHFLISGVLAALLLILATPVISAVAQAHPLSVGESIYRAGILSAALPVTGLRAGGANVVGAAAACVNCHRRSGLGTAEGSTVIPPITEKYLYRSDAGHLEDMDLIYAQGRISLRREAYDDPGLARTIREGLGRDGRKLGPLMPHYPLDDAEMASLIAYLKTLSKSAVPGVSDDTLHFATIITPDADPLARRGMLDVLERFFEDKNQFIRGGRRVMQDHRTVAFRVTRRWQLHVWELKGPPESWQAQLHSRLAAEPVFAVISGLGGRTWEPVHRFCEQDAIPCLFPNMDLPVVAERDFYPVYFSRGVHLEADLIAAAITGKERAQRVLQIFREDDIGAAAAQSLSAAVNKAGLLSLSRPVKAASAKDELPRIVQEAGPDDVLVFWLRRDDLLALPGAAPTARQVYISGLMDDFSGTSLPAAWRPLARMTYPVDLPKQRQFRTTFPHGWFRIRHIPVVADRVQSDTYLACGILAEALTDMLDIFERDFLVERIEDMVSRRALSGYYPRLGLAPGQRFASKGGYMVHFADADGADLAADGEWITP